MEKLLTLKNNDIVSLLTVMIRENLIGFMVAALNYLLVSESSMYIMEILNVSTAEVMDWLKILFYAFSMMLSFRLSWYIIDQRIRIMRAKADIMQAEAAERNAEARVKIHKIEKELKS